MSLKEPLFFIPLRNKSTVVGYILTSVSEVLTSSNETSTKSDSFAKSNHKDCSRGEINFLAYLPGHGRLRRMTLVQVISRGRVIFNYCIRDKDILLRRTKFWLQSLLE